MNERSRPEGRPLNTSRRGDKRNGTNWRRAFPGQPPERWEVRADLRARQLSTADAGLWDDFVGDRTVGEAMDELVGLLIESGIIGRRRAA